MLSLHSFPVNALSRTTRSLQPPATAPLVPGQKVGEKKKSQLNEKLQYTIKHPRSWGIPARQSQITDIDGSQLFLSDTAGQ